PFAVIGEGAAPYIVPAAMANFPKPVGVRERLARGAAHVGFAPRQDLFRLIEIVNATRHDHGRRQVSGADGPADLRGGRDVAAKRPTRIAERRRHAFPPAWT